MNIIEEYKCPCCSYSVCRKTSFMRHINRYHPNIDIETIKNDMKYCKTQQELDEAEKKLNTFIEKYGVSNPAQSQCVRDKMKKTNLEKYGVENPSQSKIIQAKKQHTTLKHYGVENPFQSDEIKTKIKETNVEKYGVENPFQSDEIKTKIKETNVEKYGVEYTTQTDIMKDKSKQTKLERYGNEFYRNDEQIQQTNLEKYGVNYGLASPDIQRKIVQTNNERYGVDRPAQLDDIVELAKQTSFEKYGMWYPQTEAHFKKNCKWKEYVLPSGNIIKVQGYEDKAIDILLKDYDETDIITDCSKITEEIGELWYEDSEGKKHRYFPDIYIKSEQLFIEVKSRYTYYKDKQKNLLKRNSVIDKGYKFKFMIFAANKNDHNINPDDVVLLNLE
jgi:hypothetical protein